MRRAGGSELRAVAAVWLCLLVVFATGVAAGSAVTPAEPTSSGQKTATPEDANATRLADGTERANGTDSATTNVRYGRSHGEERQPTLLTVSTTQQAHATVGVPASVAVSVTAVRTVENVTVRVYGSSTLTVTPDVSTLSRLREGRTERLPITAALKRQVGSASEPVLVEFTGTVDGTTFTRRKLVEVSTEARTETAGASAQDDGAGAPATGDNRVGAPVTGDDATATTGDTADDSRVASDDSSQGSTTVTGTFRYEDDDGSTYPGRQLDVIAWDRDAGGSDVLATGTTDSSGHFSLSFDPNTDGETTETGTADLFVTVEADNPAARVTQDDRDLYYVYTSTTSDVESGTTYGYGSFQPTDSTFDQVFQAADWALDGYTYVRDNTDGYTRPQVRIEYPAGDWPLYRYRYNPVTGEMDRSFEHIRLPDKTTQYWGEPTVYHEYGHALMSPMYEWNVYERPQEGSYSCHFVFSETDPGFAVVEGWAEFIEGAVSGDPAVVTSGRGTLETNAWYDLDYDPGPCPGADRGALDGNSVEGSVAAALFDVIDTGNADDEPLERSFGDVFDTMADNNVQSGTGFVAAWQADGRGDEDALTRTFTRYGVVDPVCERCDVATDVDGDGRYEDVDGDGDLTFFDVLALYDYLQRGGTSPAVAPFDFDGNGDLTFFDVLALYDEFQSA